MKKKYKCISCCKEVNKPKSFGGVYGHCRPGDLTYNNNDLFAAIENVDNISVEVIKDNRQSISDSNVIGCEYFIVIQPFLNKKRIGSKIRYGKYKALIIDNERKHSSNHKIKIIRELTDFEKLLLIIKKDYKRILSIFNIEIRDVPWQPHRMSLFDSLKFNIKNEIRQIKYNIENEDFSTRYDNR